MLSPAPGAAISVILVGLGTRTRSKTITAFASLVERGYFNIVGAFDPATRAAFIVGSSTVHVSESLDEALNTRPQLAYLSLPHDQYVSTVTELLKRGVDVIMEKPFTTTVTDAYQLSSCAALNSSKLSIMCQRRFSQRYDTLRRLLPKVGSVAAVHVEETINAGNLASGWRAQKSAAGGGVVLDMGYHMLDQLVGLFGPVEHIQHAQLIKSRNERYDVEDSAHIALRFPDNVRINVVLSRAGTQNSERIRIIGELGTLTLNVNEVSLYALHQDGTLHLAEQVACSESTGSFLERALATYDLSPEDPRWSCARDIHVMELIEGIYKSFGTEWSNLLETADETLRPWTWPRITPSTQRAISTQLTKTLSIVGKDGVFGEFEEAFAKLPHAEHHHTLLHNSGTNALHALYFAAGIGPGDLVLVPVYTFHATVSPLMQLGARPMFIDCKPNTGNTDPDELRETITSAVKAVVVTHMWGMPCEMADIISICHSHGVLLLEDCSHSHGARVGSKLTGTFGDGAAWSVQGEKFVSGGEGGVTMTRHKDWHYKMLLHGHYNKRCKLEVPKDHPLRPYVLTGTGLKNRAHPIAIAIAHEQLQRLQAFLSVKSSVAAYVRSELRPIPFLRSVDIAQDMRSAWYVMVWLFVKDATPKSLTRNHYVQEVFDAGFKEVDIPSSTKPLLREALYNTPWKVLPHLYSPYTFPSDSQEGSFPGAVSFSESMFKIPVWGHEDDWPTVRHNVAIMKEVAERHLPLRSRL